MSRDFSKGSKLVALIVFAQILLAGSPINDSSHLYFKSIAQHEKADRLWSEGQELYQQGRLKEALKRFKASYSLEPEDQRGIYLFNLIADLDSGINVDTSTGACRCYQVFVGSSKKVLPLSGDWVIEVTPRNEIKVFKRVFPFYPVIQILKTSVACNDLKCQEKFFEDCCRRLSSKFSFENRKREDLGGSILLSVRLKPKSKRYKKIYTEFFVTSDGSNAIGIVVSSTQSAMSKGAIYELRQILLALTGQVSQCCRDTTLIKAPFEVQRLKREIDEIFNTSNNGSND